ncbi:MAG: hypothetical protein R2787_17825 [Saprospiraceae bacterium]
MNNPVRFIDPDGMRVQSTHLDSEGNEIAHFNDGDNCVYRHNNINPGTHPDGKRAMLGQLRELNGTSGGGVWVGTESIFQRIADTWESFTSTFLPGQEGQVKANGGVQLSPQYGQGKETRFSQNADVGPALDDLMSVAGVVKANGNTLKSNIDQRQFGSDILQTVYSIFDPQVDNNAVDSTCNMCGHAPHPGWEYSTFNSAGRVIDNNKKLDND